MHVAHVCANVCARAGMPSSTSYLARLTVVCCQPPHTLLRCVFSDICCAFHSNFDLLSVCPSVAFSPYHSLLLSMCTHTHKHHKCMCISTQELHAAVQQHAPSLMAQIDDLYASFGMDPNKGTLTDAEYAGEIHYYVAQFGHAYRHCGRAVIVET